MEKQIMPEMKIISLGGVVKFLGRLASRFPEGAPDYMSDHYRGAAAMLDAHLDAQEELPFPAYEPLPIIERPDAGQLTSRWDDMGNYYEH